MKYILIIAYILISILISVWFIMSGKRINKNRKLNVEACIIMGFSWPITTTVLIISHTIKALIFIFSWPWSEKNGEKSK